VPVYGFPSVEQPLGDASADDHDAFGAPPVAFIEIAPCSNRYSQGREVPGGNRAKPGAEVILFVLTSQAFDGKCEADTEPPGHQATAR